MRCAPSTPPPSELSLFDGSDDVRERRASRSETAPTPSGMPTSPTCGRVSLRLSRARAVGPGGRPPLQSRQAAARPLRPRDQRDDPLERRALGARDRPPGGGSDSRSAGQRGKPAQVRRRRVCVHVGRRSAAEDRVGRQRHLRVPRQRDDDAAPGGPGPLCAAPTSASRATRSSATFGASASPPSSCSLSITSWASGSSPSGGW